MQDVKVKLLRPLDGKPDGETATYPEVDAKRLQDGGVVKILGPAAAEKPQPEVEVKAEPAPENKMEAAPVNKGAAPRRAKKAS